MAKCNQLMYLKSLIGVCPYVCVCVRELMCKGSDGGSVGNSVQIISEYGDSVTA